MEIRNTKYRKHEHEWKPSKTKVPERCHNQRFYVACNVLFQKNKVLNTSLNSLWHAVK